MAFVLQPWQLLIISLAGWVNTRQQAKIEFLEAENKVLKEKLGKKRLLLNDDQRRLLAVEAHALGRQGLENHLIDPNGEIARVAGKIECRERLGAILKYYHRAAA